MHRNLLAAGLLIVAFTGRTFTQSGGGGYPFDTPVDPRSVAMGESFVALPSDPAALMYNPAGLAGLSGLGISYSRKNQDWFVHEWSFSSVNVVAGTSFGVFAAQYNRKSMGTTPVTTVYFPDGNGSEVTLYSHDAAVGYAYRLPVGLAIGASAKYYDFVETISGPINGGIGPWKTTPAYLFDFGLTYTLPRLHTQEALEDSITLGLSYQNIGSPWKYEYPQSADQHILVGYNPGPIEYQMPEYFRIGLSYSLGVRPAHEGDLSPFAAVISGEFRSLQAPLQSNYYLLYYGPVSPPPETSYWGIGAEFTIFEFLTVRGGAAFRPYSDAEGERDRASLRYGGALHLPLQKLGAGIPLLISVQYTVIPVSTPNVVSFTSPAGGFSSFQDGTNRGTFPLFSIDVQYSGDPW